MGSVPSSLTGGHKRTANNKTAVQQICIDQHSGQVHQVKRNGGPSETRRLRRFSSSLGERLKQAAKGKAKTDNEATPPSQLFVCQQRLADAEAVKNELEKRLAVLEREKRDMLEADWSWRREIELVDRTTAAAEAVPGTIPASAFFREPLDQSGMLPADGTRKFQCHCARGWEEQMAQRLRERDQCWSNRLADEVAKRRQLLLAIEAMVGPEKMAELLQEEEKLSNDSKELLNNKPEKAAEFQAIKGRAKSSSFDAAGHQQQMNSNSNVTEKQSTSSSAHLIHMGETSSSQPSTRQSTAASTIHSARNNEAVQAMATFRPARRSTWAGGAKANVLDLDGICLDERCAVVPVGATLTEESEEGDEEVLPTTGTSSTADGQQHQEEGQRRASTSAKSRDSGISY